MGCSSCGGSGGGARAFMNTGSGSGWASAASRYGNEPLVWIVTYPDGRTEEFASDSDAYRALAKTGGGIRSETR